MVDQPLAFGSHRTFLGGVGVDVLMHGMTGIGTAMQPTSWAYLTFWGKGSVKVNGQLIEDDRMVHGMLTQRVRDIDGDYHLGFESEIPHFRGEHFHLLVTNNKVMADGSLMTSPAPSAYTLPNGATQPFMHIMYENVEWHANHHNAKCAANGVTVNI